MMSANQSVVTDPAPDGYHNRKYRSYTCDNGYD